MSLNATPMQVLVLAYQALQASLEAKSHQLADANERLHVAAERTALIEAERHSLCAMVDNFDARQKASGEPGERSETTYLNIIGALGSAAARKVTGGDALFVV